MVSDNVIIVVTLTSAFLIGLGAGPLWVSQSFYLTECANDLNKGRYNSLFYGIFQVANLITYPIAGFMIKNFRKSTFYWVMTAIGVAGSIFFLLLGNP